MLLASSLGVWSLNSWHRLSVPIYEGLVPTPAAWFATHRCFSLSPGNNEEGLLLTLQSPGLRAIYLDNSPYLQCRMKSTVPDLVLYFTFYGIK